MFSFRSILVAAAAFATLASAIPLGPDTGLTSGSSDLIGPSLMGGAPHIVGAGSSNSPIGDAVRRGGYIPPPKIFQTCHDQLVPIIVEIKAIIAVDGFNHQSVIDLVLKIVVILQGVIVDLQAVVDAKVDLGAILLLDGKACTLNDLAVLLYGILDLVVVLLAVVLKLVAGDGVLCGHIYTIGGLLGEVVDIICSLVPGLVKIVASLAIDLVANLKVLECTQVLAKLHLS